MANTFTQLNYHCVWSTKNRAPLIRPEIETQVWKILNTVAEKHGMFIKRAGGIENHVHVLIEIPKTLALSDAMKRLKGGSSNAISQSGLLSTPFAWQDGYASFTVSKSQEPDLIDYIDNQRAHHQKQSFEEEFVAFLQRHEIAYDAKYLWD